MIEVYTANTPNGVKVTIALEELGVPYRLTKVNLGALEQKQPSFLKINPNGRIPAIVDTEGPNGQPLSVFESGAILWYLAEKYAGLLPTDPVARVRAMEWTFFQAGGVGPMFGQAGWFSRNAPDNEVGLSRYREESKRLTGVLEARLSEVPYLAGEDYSIADIMNFGWLRIAGRYLGLDMTAYPAVSAWVARIAERPAVARGLAALE